MSNQGTNGTDKCRVGLFSRIDFPGSVYRQGLVEKAKEMFEREDVHFVILAGGLIAFKVIKAMRADLKRQIGAVGKLIRAQIKEIKRLTRLRETRAREDAARLTEARSELHRLQNALDQLDVNDAANDAARAELETQIAAQQTVVNRIAGLNRANDTRHGNRIAEAEETLREHEMRKTALLRELEQLTPQSLAEQLSRILPVFTNAAGEPVNLYIVPSPTLDDDDGDETAQILQEMREDVRVYEKRGDRFIVKQANKEIEVLVPLKGKANFGGDYHSTPCERLIEDRLRAPGGQRNLPDMFVVGGIGVSIIQPAHRFERPYVSVPACSCIHAGDSKQRENQIGVTVLSIHPEHDVPLVRNLDLGDMVSREREVIRTPKKCNKERRAIIEVLKARGRSPTGTLADLTGLSREKVEAELQGLITGDRPPRNKWWPGVQYDRKSRRWDFNERWKRERLPYPPLATEFFEDSILAYGCLHAGSVNTDYEFFLRKIPQIILERGATMLVGAGDFSEGIKHNLILRGEVFGGMNVTQMEQLAGEMNAHVNVTVFRERFPLVLEHFRQMAGDRELTENEVRAAVYASLLENVMIPGNHDLWVVDVGITPLTTLQAVMLRRIVDAVEEDLSRHGLYVRGLNALVESRIVIPHKGKYDLPSGLRMTVLHPWMSNTKTGSIRPQQMLAMARDSQVVIGANFHASRHINVRNEVLGQRTCLDLPTLKHETDFENNKLKIVGQGFAFLKVRSVDRRIVETEATFYNSDPARASRLDPTAPYRGVIEALNLTPDDPPPPPDVTEDFKVAF